MHVSILFLNTKNKEDEVRCVLQGLCFLFISFIFLEMPLEVHLLREAKQIIAY